MQQLPGLRPEEVVFIDDTERMLAPAREHGIRTIVAESPEQIMHDVESLLVSKV